MAVNAEVFSQFNNLVGAADGRSVFAIGNANGTIGYLPAAQAYREGAYEVLWAMFFYNKLRPKCGGLELLAERSRRMIAPWFPDGH